MRVSSSAATSSDQGDLWRKSDRRNCAYASLGPRYGLAVVSDGSRADHADSAAWTFSRMVSGVKGLTR